MNNTPPVDSQSGIVQMNLKTESTLAQKSALQSQGGQMVVLWFEPHHFKWNHAKETTAFPQRNAIKKQNRSRLLSFSSRVQEGLPHNNKNADKVTFNPEVATHLNKEQSFLITWPQRWVVFSAISECTFNYTGWKQLQAAEWVKRARQDRN